MAERDVQALIAKVVLEEDQKKGFGKKLFNPETRSDALSGFNLSGKERLELDQILEEVEGLDGLIEACMERGLIRNWPKVD